MNDPALDKVLDALDTVTPETNNDWVVTLLMIASELYGDGKAHCATQRVLEAGSCDFDRIYYADRLIKTYRKVVGSLKNTPGGRG